MFPSAYILGNIMNKPELITPKILFVDDETNVLSAMLRLFYEEPYQLLTASGGEEALELLEKNGSVQLVISDYRMPGMTGAEFLQQVMKRWPDTRRVILSGYTDTEVLLDALNGGRVHHFVVKPWNDDEIKAIVRDMLDEYEMLVNFRQGAEELARSNRLLSRTNEQLSVILADVLANMRDSGTVRKDMHYQAIPDHNLYDLLSNREREIMLLLSAGHSPKAIATDLALSIKTVSTYKKRIFTKMAFNNDTDLIIYTLKNNLLPSALL